MLCGSSDDFCRNIMQFQNELHHKTEQLDNLICKLCQYYLDIKTKYKLTLDVSAGSRKSTILQ